MFPSVDLCRSQEALHLVRASDASLENVRMIATVAAAAWGQEALLAEAREGRRKLVLRSREESALFRVLPDSVALEEVE